jgi:hypothetical protein
MGPEAILKELEELAMRSGITLRFEKGDFDGGYCVLKAERLIVVNRKLAPTKKASVVAQAIAEVGVEELYLKPAVREFIEDELAKLAPGDEVPLQETGAVVEPTLESAASDQPPADVRQMEEPVPPPPSAEGPAPESGPNEPPPEQKSS